MLVITAPGGSILHLFLIQIKASLFLVTTNSRPPCIAFVVVIALRSIFSSESWEKRLALRLRRHNICTRRAWNDGELILVYVVVITANYPCSEMHFWCRKNVMIIGCVSANITSTSTALRKKKRRRINEDKEWTFVQI
jgi:hypothetical protein